MNSLHIDRQLVAMNSPVVISAKPMREELLLICDLPVIAASKRPVRSSQPASFNSTIEVSTSVHTFRTTSTPESNKAFPGCIGDRGGNCFPRVVAGRLARVGARHGGGVWRGRFEDTRSNHRGSIASRRGVFLGVLTNFFVQNHRR